MGPQSQYHDRNQYDQYNRNADGFHRMSISASTHTILSVDNAVSPRPTDVLPRQPEPERSASLIDLLLPVTSGRFGMQKTEVFLAGYLRAKSLGGDHQPPGGQFALVKSANSSALSANPYNFTVSLPTIVVSQIMTSRAFSAQIAP